ncbi:hypothetical protein HK096_009398 [Nowakowskiella sp. JEL0078]|nr:hypothetical protein HK096_009398 [Nowakowskiella sp. JEL0078]
MAEAEGKKLSVRYIRDVVRKEGIGFLGPNFLPLLAGNAAVATVLFNTYGYTYDYLIKDGFQYHHPFLAGFTSGLVQSVLATPFDNIQRVIDPTDLVAQRSIGMFRYTVRSVQANIPTNSISSLSKFLFHAFPFVAFRDSLGFMMFFGIYEGLRHAGKRNLSDFFKNKELTEPNDGSYDTQHIQKASTRAASVIFAGAMAGTAFQLITYPLEQIRPIIMNSETILEKTVDGKDATLDNSVIRRERWANQSHAFFRKRTRIIRDRFARWSAIGEVLRTNGLKTFFSGIGPQLIKSMPASALALLAYELTLSDEK